jgi:drug/metabolite transporter (DMT)-like permease
MWAFAGLLSALFLGIYDIFKKRLLNSNEVLPVLFFYFFSTTGKKEVSNIDGTNGFGLSLP